MDLGLKDKVIMVAAGSKGLGYGIARQAAMEGAKVSIASRDAANVEHAVAALREECGGTAAGFVMDARNNASIEAWAKGTVEQFGGLDGLVVNAGGPPVGKFDDFDDDAWQSAFELTLLSSVRMIRAALPAIRKRGGGSIITLTSTSMKEPIDILLLSNVMRSGVGALMKSLATEFAPQHIRVNNLVPGRIDTQRVRSLDATAARTRGITVDDAAAANFAKIPLSRYGTIDEFGKAGAFLLSDAASYITGETLIVDGGMTRTVW